MAIRFERTELCALDGVYCMEAMRTGAGLQIVAASEIHDGACVAIDFASRRARQVWPGPGGCMNVAQLDDTGRFVAVQNFYKGGLAQDSRVVLAQPQDGGWQVSVLFEKPFLHHCGVVKADGRVWVLASTLCETRAFKGDWSHPGQVYAIELHGTQPGRVETVLPAVTKNHGFWQGDFDGRPATLISGDALYCVRPPRAPGEGWRCEKLIDREISDVAAADIDGDGEDELLTIEGLHGDLAAVNKRVDGAWQIAATCPLQFGHPIWGGVLLGRPCWLVGSQQGDSRLLLLQKEDAPGLTLKTTVVDSGLEATNCRGFCENGESYVLAADQAHGRLALYRLRED